MSLPGPSLFVSIRLTYGQNILRLVRQFIRERCRIVRFREHLWFNHRCKSEKLVPKALRVKALVNTTEGRRIAQRSSLQFLSARISLCYSTIQQSTTALRPLEIELEVILDSTTLSLVTSSVTERESIVKSKFHSNHVSKLDRLRIASLPYRSQPPPNPRWVLNLSSRTLTPDETSVLSKGLNFAPAPSFIPTTKILAAIEPALLRVPYAERDALRSDITNVIVHSSAPPPNLSRSEASALKDLKRVEDIVILPADKGRTSVVLNSVDYREKALDLLGDVRTYSVESSDPTDDIQKDMNKRLKLLYEKDKLGKFLYDRLRCTTGNVPQFYGLPKIHKENVPLRPIVSFCSSPTYSLSKHLSSILRPLIGNTPRTVQTPQAFCDIIRDTTISSDDSMVSFDVVSLFTCIPCTPAVAAARDRLRQDTSLSERTDLTRTDICDLLTFCLKSTTFSFQGQFYRQKRGTAMGSPVSSVVADLYMEAFEEKALDNCGFNIKMWKRYVDDTFVILPTAEVERFLQYLNSIDEKIQFTLEMETNNTLPFLDVTVTRDTDGTLHTSVYRKPTHTDRYLDFKSHHPACHKASVVRSLSRRITSHCSDDQKKSAELQHTASALKMNGYPKRFVSQQVRSTIIQETAETETTDNQEPDPVQPNRGTVVLPYINGMSEKIARLLRRADVKVFYKPCSTLRNQLSRVKDPVPLNRVTGSIYEYSCKDCHMTYIGQTKRPVEVRCKEHRKAVQKADPNSRIAEHVYTEDHEMNFDEVKLLHRNVKNPKSRLLLESWETYGNRGNAINTSTTLPEPYRYLSRLQLRNRGQRGENPSSRQPGETPLPWQPGENPYTPTNPCWVGNSRQPGNSNRTTISSPVRDDPISSAPA